MTVECPSTPVLELTGIAKRYGVTKALDGVDFEVGQGEIVGLIGHNGAGKSTLMRVIVGITKPDAGLVRVNSTDVGPAYSMLDSRRLGVRIAYQELSLAPDLKVYENVLLGQPSLSGPRWRRRGEAAVREALDEVFPGHRIPTRQPVNRLSLAQQQMLEITLALLEVGDSFSLLILDEPTSALAQAQAENLFAYLGKLRDRGIATILISHKLKEVLAITDRVVVMRDGAVVSEQATSSLNHERIIALMGGVAPKGAHTSGTESVLSEAEDLLRATNVNDSVLRDVSVTVRAGEIVGLAGLDGQGQQHLLHYLWRNRGSRHGVRLRGGASFVTGDRTTSGVFELWTVAENVGVGVMRQLSRGGVVRRGEERTLVSHWMRRLAIRGTASTPILDLSGGNQQKGLIARALAASSTVVILDDPFRGVDIETKQQVYLRMREEAANGRAFLWFTTENAELAECDRVYVMAEGRIAAELSGSDITEEAVIATSFERA